MKLRSYAVALGALSLFAGGTPAVAGASDALPDLAMYRLLDFRVEETPDDRRLLRYTTIIVNIGAGNFELTGSRESAAEPEMSVVQRIFDDAGGSRVRPTAARMYFAGDGHTHWHTRDLERATLDPVGSDLDESPSDDGDDGTGGSFSAKHGFCFFDNTNYNLLLPGAPRVPFYTTCGKDPNVLTQTMGLSIGWADTYRYSLPDQWIDITDLKPGRYRLTSTADAENWFEETDETNNFTWTELQIRRHGQPRVTAQGPFAPLPTL